MPLPLSPKDLIHSFDHSSEKELKVADDRYVKDLRKLAEELDLMIERMEGQINTLTRAYREEVVQMKVGRDPPDLSSHTIIRSKFKLV